ncbi:DUF4097 family beta strand repeat-containing protein [Actinoplanes friuliensis]|uniref:Adhesin domain-containing protein n=1 Tax=Actinoplanes friuliensis DSM 7358 TaxID=1246995 RepID=U5W0Z0_9ACTN|nr:hypothetical protein [Actinoplanes friuliensis]AGZ42682.1 hypothetical protein AFR_22060 [Actinoplanes friuliensis DSM 7358]
MPTFETPRPIEATLELVVGDARVTAGDQARTVVEVRPSNPGTEADVRTAEQTRVEFSDGRLLVKTPKTLRGGIGLFGKTGSVDVEVSLPTGSTLRGDAAVAAFHCTGTLGDTRIKTATGDVRLDRTGALAVTTSGGAIVASSVDGTADLKTATGLISVGDITGGAVVKNSNGETRLGAVGGDLRAKNSNGDIVVGQARAGVDAATANGSVRIGAVHRGAVSLRTAAGSLEVGIAVGTSAYLDLHTQFGKVLNELESTGAPEAGAPSVEINARTSFGNIVVHRAPAGEN